MPPPPCCSDYHDNRPFHHPVLVSFAQSDFRLSLNTSWHFSVPKLNNFCCEEINEKNGCVQQENSSPCVKYDVSEKARQDGAGGASRRSRRGGVKIKLFRSPVR